MSSVAVRVRFDGLLPCFIPEPVLSKAELLRLPKPYSYPVDAEENIEMPTSHGPRGPSLLMQLMSQASPLLGNGNSGDPPALTRWVEGEENTGLGSAQIREVDAGSVNYNPVLPPAYDSSWANRRRGSSQIIQES